MSASHKSRKASPEDVFLEWLLLLPLGADIAEVAANEIDRLDRHTTQSGDLMRLRQLFSDAIAAYGRH